MNSAKHMSCVRTIGEVAQIAAGFGFPKEKQGKDTGKYPFAKVSDISRAVSDANGHLSKATNYVDDKDLTALRAKTVPKGATVFAKIGEAFRLNRRALTEVECVIDNNCMALIPLPEIIDPEYLYRFMQTIDLSPLSVATSIPSVRKGDIADIAIYCPPLDEQRHIVKRIETVRKRTALAAIELNKVSILIRRYRECILNLAYEGKLSMRGSSKFVRLGDYIESLEQGWSPRCDAIASDDPLDWAVIKTTAIQSSECSTA